MSDRSARILLVMTLGIGLVAMFGCQAINPGSGARGRNIMTLSEQDGRSVLALRTLPHSQARRRIVLIADNKGTETTDLIVPYGILRAAEVADVSILSSGRGPVTLMPALSVLADATVAEFEASVPQGADIVIVPAMHDPTNPVLRGFLQHQAARGAAIVSICEGAWVVAGAGLLEGRSATTHWYAFAKIARRYPQTTWVRDRRYVIDGRIMSTTGVSASIPAALVVLESVAGQQRARAVAASLGVKDWGSSHDSVAFTSPALPLLTIVGNWLSVWGHERIELSVERGFDEVALALQADAWSRTYRSRLVATAAAPAVRSRHGLTLIPETPRAGAAQVALFDSPAVPALDATLTAIAARYGQPTATWVARQIEYRR